MEIPSKTIKHRQAQVSYKLTLVDSYKDFAFPVKYPCFLLLSTDQYDALYKLSL